MPVGQPDWSPTGQAPVVTGNFDSAELAVRLGSAVNYDRTGKLLFSDVFTRYDGLYTATKIGAVVGPAVDTNIAEYADSSLLSTIPLGVGNRITLGRLLRTWQNENLSVEAGFYTDQIPNRFSVRFQQNVDGVAANAIVIIDTAGTRLRYLDSAAAYQTITTLTTTPLTYKFFSAIKLDVDFTNNEYRGVWLNDVFYNLSNITLRTIANASPNHQLIEIACDGNAGSALAFYLDRILVTVDY